MKRKIVTDLIAKIKEEYGDRYTPYGTHEDEEEGTGFRLTDIPATFSVLSFGETPQNVLDIQIESYPPGDYLYNDELTLNKFMDLIEQYRKPQDQWPLMKN